MRAVLLPNGHVLIAAPPGGSWPSAGAWEVGPAHPDYARWRARAEAARVSEPDEPEPEDTARRHDRR